MPTWSMVVNSSVGRPEGPAWGIASVVTRGILPLPREPWHVGSTDNTRPA
jgi:hypothetical protein